MINLFEQAINKNEFLDFALGKNEYFIIDRDYGEHSVIGSWINYILPLTKVKKKAYIEQAIQLMFYNIIEGKNISEQEKNENLLNHLFTYYYLLSEKRIHEISFNLLNIFIENLFNSYILLLKEKKDSKLSAFENAIEIIKSRGGLSTEPLK